MTNAPRRVQRTAEYLPDQHLQGNLQSTDMDKVHTYQTSLCAV